MNTRLQQFLTMEGLTPARFAELMGIQRSGISHLLAGRNKPSFEFIQKILTLYPNLNPDWLILGKGKPYKESDTSIILPDIPPVQDVKKTEKQISTNEDEEPDLFSDISDEEQDSVQPIEIKTDTHDFEHPEPSENPIKEINSTKYRQKNISRITVFYSDGTFEER